VGSDSTSFFKREVLRLEPGTPQWILYAAAAFGSVVEHPQTLIGGAQVHYTQQSRPTDIDMVGRIASRGYGSPGSRRVPEKRSPLVLRVGT